MTENHPNTFYHKERIELKAGPDRKIPDRKIEPSPPIFLSKNISVSTFVFFAFSVVTFPCFVRFVYFVVYPV
jgi:hypothetical protein